MSLPPSASKRSALLARSVHPLNWASLPPPAQSLSIPHKCSLHPLSWASPPSSCKPTAPDFLPLSWASLPPPPSSGSTPLTRSMLPHSWAGLSPLATVLSLWVTSQLGEISALSAGLACRPPQARDRHPLPTACSPSGEATFWVNCELSEPPAAASGRAFRPQLARDRSPIPDPCPPLSWASPPPPARPVGFCIQVARDLTLVIHLQDQRSVCRCFSHCAESVSLL